MKKSIFELNDKEVKKLNLELIRTHYFKRYFVSYLVITLVSFLVVMLITMAGDFDKEIMLNELIIMFLFILYTGLISLLFLFKMFDLAKKYYVEKKKDGEI